MSISQDVFEKSVSLNYSKVIVVYRSFNEIIEKKGFFRKKIKTQFLVIIKMEDGCTVEIFFDDEIKRDQFFNEQKSKLFKEY